MLSRYIALPLIPLSFLSTPVVADKTELDTIVVTATKTTQSISNLASSITVISANDIQLKQFQTLADALKTVPGLQVVQSGQMGTQTSVFTRGNNSNHTLVLIDGIEINDPSSPNGAFDFANLTLDDVEQIEIVKGAQSVLYGSDALGGVIHIRTKSGRGVLKASVKLEVGSNQSHREVLSISGSQSILDYAIQYSSLRTDGESIAARKRLSVTNGSRDDDGYSNDTFAMHLGLTPSSLFEADLFVRYLDTNVETDSFLADDVNARNQSKQLYVNAEMKGYFLNDNWHPTISFSHTNLERKNKDDRLVVTDNLVNTQFDGQKNKLAFQNDFYFKENHIITVGLETEKESIKNSGFTSFGDTGLGNFIINERTDADRRTNSIYLQDQINLDDKLNIVLGLRHDNPEDFDSETTYRGILNYRFDNKSKIHFAYGTGFKAPSLFELSGFSPNTFGAFRGNPNLKPETSKDWEAGFQQTLWQNKLNFSTTYFSSEVKDLIETVFSPSNTTVNNDEVTIRGLETRMAINLTPAFSLTIDHTFTRTQDENKQSLVRRPLHKASLEVNYTATQQLSFHSSLLHIGSRKDIDAVGNRIKVGGYSTINLAAQYTVNPNVRLYSRVENIGDKTYEPAFGFQASGTSIYAGVEVQYR